MLSDHEIEAIAGDASSNWDNGTPYSAVTTALRAHNDREAKAREGKVKVEMAVCVYDEDGHRTTAIYGIDDPNARQEAIKWVATDWDGTPESEPTIVVAYLNKPTDVPVVDGEVVK